MRGFHHLDRRGRTAIAIASDNDTFQRAVPQRLERSSKLSCAFARANDHHPAFRPFGKMRGQRARRVSRGDGGLEKPGQEGAVVRFHTATSKTKTPSAPPSSSATIRPPTA